ncbi:MAG: heme-binding protein [Gammaproteobacteria bacterium]|nr:heme-binding protein [Gammaproteobacteria bacterium]
MAQITLEQANQLIALVLERARKEGLPPLAVAVLDAGGHLKALQREDGQTFLRVQVCQSKAWGALGMGMDSSGLAARFDSGDRQKGFFQALNALTGGRVVALPGGVLIRDAAGEVVGAIGVSGAVSEDDEACAVAAVSAAGFQPGPG